MEKFINIITKLQLHLFCCVQHIFKCLLAIRIPYLFPFLVKFFNFSSVQSLSCVRLFVTHGLQHVRPPHPSPAPRVYWNSCPLSQWCHPAVSSSVVPFSSCLQSFPTSVSFQMNQFFTSGGQSIGVSASASVLPMNKYSGLISFRIDWFDLLPVFVYTGKNIFFGKNE